MQNIELELESEYMDTEYMDPRLLRRMQLNDDLPGSNFEGQIINPKFSGKLNIKEVESIKKEVKAQNKIPPLQLNNRLRKYYDAMDTIKLILDALYQEFGGFKQYVQNNYDPYPIENYIFDFDTYLGNSAEIINIGDRIGVQIPYGSITTVKDKNGNDIIYDPDLYFRDFLWNYQTVLNNENNKDIKDALINIVNMEKEKFDEFTQKYLNDNYNYFARAEVLVNWRKRVFGWA